MFTIKEDYQLIIDHNQIQQDLILSHIWTLNLCPKFANFQWLLFRHKALTWDRIIKGAFYGPYFCYMCKQKQEIDDHIYNVCSYVEYFWT